MNNQQTFRIGVYDVTVSISLTKEESDWQTYMRLRNEAYHYLELCRAGVLATNAELLLERVNYCINSPHGKDGKFLEIVGVTLDEIQELAHQGKIQKTRIYLDKVLRHVQEGDTYGAGRDMYYVQEGINRGVTYQELGTTEEEIHSLPAPISPYRGKP